MKIRKRLWLGVLPLFVAHVAAAQAPVDAPAIAVPGSCKRVGFNLGLLESPVRIDLAVQVSESGRPLSAVPISPVARADLLAAVVASALSCEYRPAQAAGKPAPGVARSFFSFDKAQAAEPLVRKPAITDPRECAPKADDYPRASLQLDETGTTRIGFTVDPRGRLTAFGVTKSSGHLRLDFTALAKLASCRFTPGALPDGTPTSASFEVDYVWRIE